MSKLKQWWRGVRPKVLPPVVHALVTAWMATVRLRTEGLEEVRALPTGKIMAGWHGNTFMATRLFRGQGVWTLISLSRDGEMQDGIFRRFGFQTIRGSTGRGGARALAESIRVLRQGATMAFTPDGPRGPSKVVQPGIVAMARKSGAVLIPVGVAARPAWRAPTWDRYLVPLPFSRGLMIFGEPITVAPDADEAEMERCRLQLETEIARLEALAEARL